MDPRNEKKLAKRVIAAAGEAVDRRGYATPIDALIGSGWLIPEQVEDWRQGHVPYLERVAGANLKKLSTVQRIFRRWAVKSRLEPRPATYVSRTRDRYRLRFSKSGDPSIERAYSTHWILRRSEGGS